MTKELVKLYSNAPWDGWMSVVTPSDVIPRATILRNSSFKNKQTMIEWKGGKAARTLSAPDKDGSGVPHFFVHFSLSKFNHEKLFSFSHCSLLNTRWDNFSFFLLFFFLYCWFFFLFFFRWLFSSFVSLPK